MPAATPITIEPTGPTKPEAGVMATRPATAPEAMPITVGLPRCAHSTNIQVRPATAVAIWVTVIAMPACMPARDGRARVEAEPADPKQRRADEGEHHVVAGRRVAALAEHEGAHQAGDARIDVHDRAAGEIEHLDPAGEIALLVGVGGAEDPSGPQTQWAMGA